MQYNKDEYVISLWEGFSLYWNCILSVEHGFKLCTLPLLCGCFHGCVWVWFTDLLWVQRTELIRWWKRTVFVFLFFKGKLSASPSSSISGVLFIGRTDASLHNFQEAGRTGSPVTFKCPLFEELGMKQKKKNGLAISFSNNEHFSWGSDLVLAWRNLNFQQKCTDNALNHVVEYSSTWLLHKYYGYLIYYTRTRYTST